MHRSAHRQTRVHVYRHEDSSLIFLALSLLRIVSLQQFYSGRPFVLRQSRAPRRSSLFAPPSPPPTTFSSSSLFSISYYPLVYFSCAPHLPPPHSPISLPPPLADPVSLSFFPLSISLSFRFYLVSLGVTYNVPSRRIQPDLLCYPTASELTTIFNPENRHSESQSVVVSCTARYTEDLFAEA